MMADKGHEPVSPPDRDAGGERTHIRSPDEARQGMIVLKGPRQRWLFFGGIIGALALAALIGLTII